MLQQDTRSHSLSLSSLITRPPPISTLFPYTTLFRSQDLGAEARKRRDDVLRSGGSPEEKQRLEKQSQELRAKLAGSDSGDVAALREQLAATNTRLRHIEQEGRIAEGIIRTYTKSVCILYVAVAFRDKQSGQRLRYAGTNPQGEP